MRSARKDEKEDDNLEAIHPDEAFDGPQSLAGEAMPPEAGTRAKSVLRGAPEVRSRGFAVSRGHHQWQHGGRALDGTLDVVETPDDGHRLAHLPGGRLRVRILSLIWGSNSVTVGCN